MKTAEQLRDEHWKSHEQWRIHRKGVRDNIVVLINNPPCGRLRSPFLSFKVFKDGEWANEVYSYEELRLVIKALKEDSQ